MSPCAACLPVAGAVVRLNAAIDELQIAAFDLETTKEAHVGDVDVRCASPNGEQGLQRHRGADGRAALAVDP